MSIRPESRTLFAELTEVIANEARAGPGGNGQLRVASDHRQGWTRHGSDHLKRDNRCASEEAHPERDRIES